MGPALKRVLLTDAIAPAGEEALSRAVEVVHAPDSAPATIRRLAGDFDGILIRSKLPDDIFDAAPLLGNVGLIRFGGHVSRRDQIE